jgi:aspartate-semialdehyde dehydrogenase
MSPDAVAPFPAPSSRIPVAVLGATGSVGQRFVSLLADHPWFELVAVAASEASVGKPYREAARWFQATPIPPRIAELVVVPAEGPFDRCGARILFSALDASVAGPLEAALAAAGHLVVSNTKNHRMDPDVPLLVPEVNAGHLALVAAQASWRRGGAILTNPNCSTIGLALTLAPLHAAFGVERVHVVTLQAVSGAGMPGVPSLSILDNVIPFIGGEEDKVERETRKIFGRLVVAEDAAAGSGGGALGIAEAPIVVSATCTRVPVLDGHTEAVSVGFRERPTLAAIREAWQSWRAEPQRLGLPSAPRQPVHVLDAVDAPQPRLHRDLDGGMAAAVGRLRGCPLFDAKYVLLSHNTVRGAAGGSLLVAELAVAEGLLAGAGAVEASR